MSTDNVEANIVTQKVVGGWIHTGAAEFLAAWNLPFWPKKICVRPQKRGESSIH